MPRKDLTLSSKIALLDKIKSQPLNTSQRRLAEITGVPKSTISRLLQQENQLREELALLDGQTGTFKRKREGKNPDVEEALDQWFSVINGGGVKITGKILKAKSEELANLLGHSDFKATDGWLSRWKARHNIKLKRTHGEKGSADIIQNYFAVCGFTPLDIPEILSDEENEINYQGFSTIDNNLPCYDENQDCKDAIVKVIKLKDEKRDEDDNDDPPVTNQEAKKCIAGLQRYFMQKGNEGSPTSALNTCADFVERQICKKKR